MGGLAEDETFGPGWGGPAKGLAGELLREAQTKLRLSKFQPCLPEAMLDEFLASGLDVQGAKKALASAVGSPTEPWTEEANE